MLVFVVIAFRVIVNEIMTLMYFIYLNKQDINTQLKNRCLMK